jgi:hypothetical protein
MCHAYNTGYNILLVTSLPPYVEKQIAFDIESPVADKSVHIIVFCDITRPRLSEWYPGVKWRRHPVWPRIQIGIWSNRRIFQAPKI